jgi:hypothetical protein
LDKLLLGQLKPRLFVALPGALGALGISWEYSNQKGNIIDAGCGFNHLEKYESQWEGLSHILWKIKMFETTNQYIMGYM